MPFDRKSRAGWEAGGPGEARQTRASWEAEGPSALRQSQPLLSEAYSQGVAQVFDSRCC